MAKIGKTDLPDLDALVNAAESELLSQESLCEVDFPSSGTFDPNGYASVVQQCNQQSKDIQNHYINHLEFEKKKLAQENEAGLLEALQQSLTNIESDHMSDFASLSCSLEQPFPTSPCSSSFMLSKASSQEVHPEEQSMLKTLLMSPDNKNYPKEVNVLNNRDFISTNNELQHRDEKSRQVCRKKTFTELLKHLEASGNVVENKLKCTNASSMNDQVKNCGTRFVNTVRYMKKYTSASTSCPSSPKTDSVGKSKQVQTAVDSRRQENRNVCHTTYTNPPSSGKKHSSLVAVDCKPKKQAGGASNALGPVTTAENIDNPYVAAVAAGASSQFKSNIATKVLKWEDYLQRVRSGTRSAPNSPTRSHKVGADWAFAPNNFMLNLKICKQSSIMGSEKPLQKVGERVPLPKPLCKTPVQKQVVQLQGFDEYMSMLKNKPPFPNRMAVPENFNTTSNVTKAPTCLESRVHNVAVTDITKHQRTVQTKGESRKLIKIKSNFKSGSSGQLIMFHLPSTKSSTSQFSSVNKISYTKQSSNSQSKLCVSNACKNKGTKFINCVVVTTTPNVSSDSSSKEAPGVTTQQQIICKSLNEPANTTEKQCLKDSNSTDYPIVKTASDNFIDTNITSPHTEITEQQLNSVFKLENLNTNEVNENSTKNPTSSVSSVNASLSSTQSFGNLSNKTTFSASVTQSIYSFSENPSVPISTGYEQATLSESFACLKSVAPIPCLQNVDENHNFMTKSSTTATTKEVEKESKSINAKRNSNKNGVLQAIFDCQASQNMTNDKNDKPIPVDGKLYQDRKNPFGAASSRFFTARSMRAAEMLGSDMLEYDEQDVLKDPIIKDYTTFPLVDNSEVAELDEPVASLEDVMKVKEETTSLSTTEKLFCKLPSYFLTGKLDSQICKENRNGSLTDSIKKFRNFVSEAQDNAEGFGCEAEFKFNKLPHYLSSGKRDNGLSCENVQTISQNDTAVKIHPVSECKIHSDSSEIYYSRLPTYYSYGRPHPNLKTFNDSVADDKDDTITPEKLAIDTRRKQTCCKTSNLKLERKVMERNDEADDAQELHFSKLPTCYIPKDIQNSKSNTTVSDDSCYSSPSSTSSSDSSFYEIKRKRRRSRGHTHWQYDKRHSSSNSRSQSPYSDDKKCRRKRRKLRSRIKYSQKSCPSTDYCQRNIKMEKWKQVQAMEERRVVYVGRIDRITSKNELRMKFIQFGNIESVSLHNREDGHQYGFITFHYACDAFRAIEEGNSGLPPNERFDLCFGGRRHFCKTAYEDLDSKTDSPEKADGAGDDFDALLSQARRSIKH